MKLSEAQGRAVELLAGEKGWVRRGSIQQKTMDVLTREGMVEARRDDALHVTVYRATQNARDWVRGEQAVTDEYHAADAALLTDPDLVESLAQMHAGETAPIDVDQILAQLRADGQIRRWERKPDGSWGPVGTAGKLCRHKPSMAGKRARWRKGR